MADTSKTASFKTSKFVITWWDLVDHYLLATMLAISLASFALQTAQDRLICIPAVDCSRNDSALCNRSSSAAVHLFKMPDRRHYDYIDNECYSKMDHFSAYYSLIFLVETVILLAISNFWQKFPNSANSVARCEYLVSEYNKGEFMIKDSPKDLLKRLEVLLNDCNKKMPRGGITKQYRYRGVLGFLVALACLIFNVVSFGDRRGWNRCNLEDVDYTTEVEASFFSCSRTVGFYFHLTTAFFFGFIAGHLLLASGSFIWAYCCLGTKPKKRITNWTISDGTGIAYDSSGDAAFLLHLLKNTGCYFVDTVIGEREKEVKEEAEAKKRTEEAANAASSLLLQSE